MFALKYCSNGVEIISLILECKLYELYLTATQLLMC